MKPIVIGLAAVAVIGAGAIFALSDSPTASEETNATPQAEAEKAAAPQVAEAEKSEDPEDLIVARIDGQVLRLGDMIKAKDSNSETARLPLTNEFVYKAILNGLVNDQLVLNAAKRAKVEEHPAVVAEITAAAKRIMSRAYLEMETLKRSSDERAKEFFDAIPEQVAYSVRHILISSAPEEGQAAEEADKAAKAKAEDLIKQIQGGADMAELAKAETDDPGSKESGGLYEGMMVHTVVKPFGDAIEAATIGELIAEPVQTQYGYHVMKVEGKTVAEMPAFETVKDQIKAQMAESIEKEIIGELQKSAEITYYDGEGKVLPNLVALKIPVMKKKEGEEAKEGDAEAASEAASETAPAKE